VPQLLAMHWTFNVAWAFTVQLLLAVTVIPTLVPDTEVVQ
jgi:hypothetical protein